MLQFELKFLSLSWLTFLKLVIIFIDFSKKDKNRDEKFEFKMIYQTEAWTSKKCLAHPLNAPTYS